MPITISAEAGEQLRQVMAENAETGSGLRAPTRRGAAQLRGAARLLVEARAAGRLGLRPGRRSSPSAAAGAAPEGAAAPTATDGEVRGRSCLVVCSR